ncbi:MAG: hypothetical protein AAGA83_06600 [Cyanobacteria bacterium P01_F01_bin.116]
MKRRDCLNSMGAVIALFPLAHTPFPQWKVYRKLHLFIVVNREDIVAYNLGQAIAHTLADEIPESRAMVTRAHDSLRLASLISTQQLDVALVPRTELMAWRDHQYPYDQLQPTSLKELFEVENYVLISRDDFRSEHATWIRETLEDHLKFNVA